MSVKKISGAEYSLSKIFSSDFDYVIPAYQTAIPAMPCSPAIA